MTARDLLLALAQLPPDQQAEEVLLAVPVIPSGAEGYERGTGTVYWKLDVVAPYRVERSICLVSMHR